jgi:hypothetical protein
VGLDHVHAREQLVQVGGDHLLQGHEGAAVAQGHEPGQDARHLDPGEAVPGGAGVADGHGQRQRQVGDVGERVAGVDGQRRQHREDLALEVVAQEVQLLVVRARHVGDADAGLGHGRHDLVQEHPHLALDAGADVLGDRLQGLAGVQPSEPRVTMPASTWSRRPDTRTMKNSSRLVEKMARYFSRSSSGTSGSAAMARTRSLNWSQEISRLMYRYRSYRSRSTASGALAGLAHGGSAPGSDPASIQPRCLGRPG